MARTLAKRASQSRRIRICVSTLQLAALHHAQSFQCVLTYKSSTICSPHFGRKLFAAPKRLQENVEGLLYINDKCINCAACSNFAPSIFTRNDTIQKHVVYNQPSMLKSHEVEMARVALAACPVAAIRVENTVVDEDEKKMKQSLSVGNEDPFPIPISGVLQRNIDDIGVYYLGHHNDASFGATPYLILGKSRQGKPISVLVDVPRFSPSAARAVKSLVPNGPDYMFLTHVDDTAHHNQWVEEFTGLKRIFHSGDLGRHNWIGDETLEDVEILLEGKAEGDEFMVWDIDGNELPTGILQDEIGMEQFVIIHTPGHSPGSISLLFRPKSHQQITGVLFTGDTYAWTTRDGGHMSGFPRYGNNLAEQAETLQKIAYLADKWQVIAPGHGHPRFYVEEGNERKLKELSVAVDELKCRS